MPFPLTDLKRSYGRGPGGPSRPMEVRPYLLVGRELAAQTPALRAATAWHEAQRGRRRAEIDPDELAQLVGDYRLARCLGACLQTYYRFETDDFACAIAGDGAARPATPASGFPAPRDPSPAARRRRTRLLELGIDSPIALRLHVYDRVAQTMGGFVAPEQRPAFVAQVAGDLLLEPAHLDELLTLDAAARQRLARVVPLDAAAASPAPGTGAPGPPTPEALAAEYNWRALATLLVRAISADLTLPHPDGAALRRFYFLVKRNGLLCDLAVGPPARTGAAPAGSERAAPRPRPAAPALPQHGYAHRDQASGPPDVAAHLFGPLEAFGPRTRHGDRFARVVLGLLRRFRGLRGEARVLINEREYLLQLDAPLGAALAAEPVEDDAGNGDDAAAGEGAAPAEVGTAAEQEPPVAVAARPEAAEHFDSAVEARLFATLRGMERRGDTKGWHFEREPEPIVHDGIVLIPDFAATRGASGDHGRVARRGTGAGRTPTRDPVELSGTPTRPRGSAADAGDPPTGDPDEAEGGGEGDAGGRVFVEVIGFWTPAYRERKRAKLRQLAGAVPLLLVVQEQLVADFADLAFPVLPYKQRPSAADLVALLGRHFDRAGQRVAGARRRLAGLLAAAEGAAGFVAEDELRRGLGLSSAGEVAEVVSRGGALPAGWTWAPGAGLCHEAWLARFAAWCAATVRSPGDDAPPSLDRVRHALAASDLPAAARAAERLDGLLPAAGFEVVWQSLFDAVVRPRAHA